jgi:hypothetical protein
MLAIPSVLDPIIKSSPSYLYYFWHLIGTISLFFATIAIGHTRLASDLRGILGYALVFEIAMEVLYFSDPLLNYYRLMQPQYQRIEFGMWCMLIGRMFWPHMSMGLPKFDFIRNFLNETSDHDRLPKWYVLCGYLLLISSFSVGYLLSYTNTKIEMAVCFAIPGWILLVHARRDAVAVADLTD